MATTANDEGRGSTMREAKTFGVLKDIKNGEYRVVATPAEVRTLVEDGVEVHVASGAGYKAGFDDADYAAAGAIIEDANEQVWQTCDFVTKVKEIEPSEYDLIREGQVVFCCIHPAAHREEVDVLLDKKTVAFSAEDSHRFGSPNCEAAGKAGAFMGLWALMSNNGGLGKFANGIGPSEPVKAIVCGAGIVGRGAIDTLYRLGVDLTVIAVHDSTLEAMAEKYPGIKTMRSEDASLAELMPDADLLLNCVRWPKDATEYMITREMVASMRRGSVICDISNDFGCIETFRETTHDDPIYVEEGVVHYCVSNIPGAIAGSTSVAYAQALLAHFRSILADGVAEACVKNGFLRRSLTCYDGYLTHEETSGIQGRPWVRPEVILGIADRDLDPAPPATKTTSDNYYPEFA